VPIYEYVCVDCGRRFEAIHAIHAPAPVACEVCGGALRKAISSPAIVFKGTGWAKKDAHAAGRRAAGMSGQPAGKTAEQAGHKGSAAGDGKPAEGDGKPAAAGGASDTSASAKTSHAADKVGGASNAASGE
jgi:putative FmdB family regulatory protein